MTNKNKVEAVLFASGRALSVDEIAEITELKPKDVKKALDQLQKEYGERETALAIFEHNGKWKVNVTEKYVPIVKKIVAETELEKPVLETLAMIAYKTPVLQSDIIKARGVGAYDHIKELLERGFITREQFGRSFKIKITDKFFNYFDVEGDKDIRELFKNVKKPEVKPPEKLGSLEVVPAESDEEHEKRIKQLRLQIYEVKKEREKDKDFLNDFDKRLEEVKSKIEEDSSIIEDQKKRSASEKPGNDDSDNNLENSSHDSPKRPFDAEEGSYDSSNKMKSSNNDLSDINNTNEDIVEEIKNKEYDDPEELVSDVDKVIEELEHSNKKESPAANPDDS